VAVPGLLALLAATAFAVGSALQQRGALRTTATGEDTRFLVQLRRQPVWLLGALMQAVGWVLQALALHEGSFVAVQTLTTLSLVIALPFGAWLTNQPITGTVVLGAAAATGGIVVFLSLAPPRAGRRRRVRGTGGSPGWAA
jgi:drug/metabolite transporter (DMT)-like permease